MLVQESAAKQMQITELEGQLAEADETAIALYEQLAAATAEAGGETGEEETA